MIVTRRIALRIAALLLLTVILQVSFFSQLHLLGASPNVVPVVIVSLGLLGGGIVGAVCGFATGIVLDSVLLQTLGVSSLVLLSIGYLAGRYRESFEIANRYIPALVAGGLTLLGAAGFAALQLMLGVDAAISLLVVREMVVQALLATAFAFAIYPLIRRSVAPALIDYEQPVGRRSLLSRLPRPRRRRNRRSARRSSVSPARVHGRDRVRGGRSRRRTGVRGGLA